MKFLLELASEEIPARMQAAAAEQLRSRFVDGLQAAGLAHGAVVSDATPRRLWLVADDVAGASAASVEERKGPAATAPEAAIAGFLRSTGLTRDQLEERATPKGVVLFAQIASPGRDAAAILAELVPSLVRDFQWPKSMRWGQASVSTASPRWVRPLTGIVAMLDSDVVPCEVHGIVAGKVTRGHRIHSPEPIEIEGPETYAAQLRDAKVVVSSGERRGIIGEKAAIAAAARGFSVVPDAGLVTENAGLTEWPVPMLGGFDPAFLAVPREVIQLTMRTNQKYFAVVDGSGALAPGFVCVANLEASDGGAAIVAGNERVLSARLSDAKFFWDQDVAAVTAGGLEAFLPKLDDIVFHEKLGTVADKVERVAKLARWLVESGAVKGDAALAETAAKLCKADLVSATVGEFPEVQGIAGAYLARVAGLDDRVADAIRDHYKPVGQGDDVPTAPVSVAVALADKLDTLVGFFAIGDKPTGSRDPFALRRAMLGVIRIILNNALFIPLDEVNKFLRIEIAQSIAKRFWAVDNFDWQDRGRQSLLDSASDWATDIKFYPLSASKYSLDDGPDELLFNEYYNELRDPPFLFSDEDSLAADVAKFLFDRLRVQLKEEGLRHDVISAVIPSDAKALHQKWLSEDLLHGLGIHQSPRGPRYHPSDQVLWLVEAAKKLSSALDTEAGLNALAAYRRANSILVNSGSMHDANEVSRIGEPTEVSELRDQVATLEPRLLSALKTRDFKHAMTAIASVKPSLDAFFDQVVVNDPDPQVRAERLALLARFRDAVHQVADFSRIEG